MKKIITIGIIGLFLLISFSSSINAIEIKENVFSSISSGDISIIDIGFVNSITLYDCETEQPMVDNNYAAYVKNSKVEVKAKFSSSIFSGQEVNIKATGSLGGLSIQKVIFNGEESDWITFQTQNNLPNSISVNEVSLEWQYEESSDVYQTITTTSHEIYALNKKPISSKVWFELAKWTTEWCSGESDDKKAIADRILQGFIDKNDFTYGKRSVPQSTPNMINNNGGMCSGMANVFYDACATQGVKTYRFAFLLDKAYTNPYEAIVFLSPGLGRTWDDGQDHYGAKVKNWRFVENAYDPFGNFRIDYNGEGYKGDSVNDSTREAYFFDQGDGHSVNLIEHEGTIYLYDLSFGTSYSDVFDKLPSDGLPSLDVLEKFRKQYHDQAVNYMYGEFPYYEFGKEVTPGTNFSIRSGSIPYSDRLPYLFEAIDEKPRERADHTEDRECLREMIKIFTLLPFEKKMLAIKSFLQPTLLNYKLQMFNDILLS